MKRFSEFLHDIKNSSLKEFDISNINVKLEESLAVQQATRLGLKSDEHGGWYKNGEFIAKTVKGKLVFYNKRQVLSKDPIQTPKEKNISDPNFNDVVDPNVQEPQQTPVAIPPTVPKTKGTITIAFGRFNPPTVGHQQLMDVAAQSAESDGGEYFIYPSRSQDKKKNPLDPDTKILYMKKMFPAHSERIVNDAENKTIFDVLKKAYNDGYANVRIVGGSERVKEFEKLSNNYNGQLYAFDAIEVVSAGDIDPDTKNVEGMSSSRMRLAAAEGDFISFRSGIPNTLNRKETLELFYNIRNSMEIKEGFFVWEIAPKLDQQTLRENYILKNVFKIGGLIENLNTGLIGNIIRRGTNYLICVTEDTDNIMFKSWIRDVREV